MLGQPALLEVLRQQREAEQEAQQVQEDRPFVAEVLHEVETRGELERGDREQSAHRDLQAVLVRKRHADQGRAEQQELERNAEQLGAATARAR